MLTQMITLSGEPYILLPKGEYDRLASLAKVTELPPLPAADAAGIRVETVCRIETGKHTASVPTIERIDRALKKADAQRRK